MSEQEADTISSHDFVNGGAREAIKRADASGRMLHVKDEDGQIRMTIMLHTGPKPIFEDEEAIRADEREACARHVENHSCVSSCCDAQPSGGEAKALADCIRARGGK